MIGINSGVITSSLSWTVALILATSPSMSSGADAAISLDVEVVVSKTTADGPVLNVAITNRDKETISLYAADLPWGVRQSLMLVPITTDHEMNRVPEALYIDDPGPGQVVIRPAQTISGTIQLTRRFPELPRVLKEREVVLFWSYVAKLPTGARTKRSSGGIVIPRTQ